MAEYIEKNELISKIDDEILNYSKTDTNADKAIISIANCLKAFIAMQTGFTDVQPVKHGYWEEVTDYGGWGDTHYRCSVCGEEWYLEDGKPKDNNMNFCPRCGARMDGDTE